MSARQRVSRCVSRHAAPRWLACSGRLPVLASPLAAQTLTNSFGGLSESSDAPIDIESDMLTVYDEKKYATFKGNVKAVQGTTTLRAAELDVHYVGGADKITGQKAPPKPACRRRQRRRPQSRAPRWPGGADQQDRGERRRRHHQRGRPDHHQRLGALRRTAQMVTVGGNVVLSQGQNVLKGERLIIDLKTGESRFENPGNAAAGGGRIRALFMPKQDGGGDDGRG